MTTSDFTLKSRDEEPFFGPMYTLRSKIRGRTLVRWRSRNELSTLNPLAHDQGAAARRSGYGSFFRRSLTTSRKARSAGGTARCPG